MRFETFPTDPGLPQLKIARDLVLMREVFRRHLRPLTGKAYHIQECLLSRVSYHRAARCILQYTLRLVEPGTGRERSQWVTGSIYTQDKAEQIWQRLREADPGPDIPEAFQTFAPVSYIPDLKMLVQVFPYDRRLPISPLLLAGPSSELEPLLLSRFGPGDWHIEAWNIEPICYRPGAALVLRHAVQARDGATGTEAEKRFYLKVYRDEKEEYQALQAFCGRADAAGEAFAVGQPIAHLSRLHAFLVEEAPGISLQQVLLQGDDPVAAICKVARALAAFHQCDVSTRRYHSHEDEVSDLKKKGALLESVCPQLRADVKEIISAVATGLAEVPPAPTHRALKAEHIFLDGDRVSFIALNAFAGADPVLDSAEVLARLAAMPSLSLLPRSRARMAAQAFAKEYFAHVPKSWHSRLPFHYAGANLHLAASIFRSQVPGWRDKVTALVSEARDSLTGKVWWGKSFFAVLSNITTLKLSTCPVSHGTRHQSQG